jgi:protein-disulfide isomerase
MKLDINKSLVIITTSVFAILAVIIFCIDVFAPKKFDLDNVLTFGNPKAEIKVVIFEDFQCKYCKEFVNRILPEIKKDYIDTNKISYTIVPVAFIYGSKVIANAAMAVYDLDKSKFFDFLKVISDKKTILDSKGDLLEIAKNLESIDLRIFKDFIDQDAYSKNLRSNLDYAKKLMKSQFQVPTIYLNGKKIKNERLKELIDYKLSYLGQN